MKKEYIIYGSVGAVLLITSVVVYLLVSKKPSPKRDVQWDIKDSPCPDLSCGSLDQTRTVTCVYGDDKSVTSDQTCIEAGLTKPSTTRTCTSNKSPTCEWDYTGQQWSECKDDKQSMQGMCPRPGQCSGNGIKTQDCGGSVASYSWETNWTPEKCPSCGDPTTQQVPNSKCVDDTTGAEAPGKCTDPEPKAKDCGLKWCEWATNWGDCNPQCGPNAKQQASYTCKEPNTCGPQPEPQTQGCSDAPACVWATGDWNPTQ